MSVDIRKSYMICNFCNHRYLGNVKCPYCGEFGGKLQSDGDDITKKTFEEPDLKKGF